MPDQYDIPEATSALVRQDASANVSQASSTRSVVLPLWFED